MTLPGIDHFEEIPSTRLRALRDTFRREGFGESIVDLADSIASGAPGAVRLPIVRNDLRRRKEHAFQLALLFTYDDGVKRSAIDAQLGGDLTDTLLGAGILTCAGDEVRCAFRIVPDAGHWILSDAVLDQADSVMPPGPTTLALARTMPERISGSVLDVGCGPGSLALRAVARGAARVLGTDINPRAIAMAKFNARWNELAAEFRTGDLLEPAAGERFDLVVSQPPFISRPESVEPVTFLHGGLRGDAIVLRMLEGLSGVLAEEGEALVLCDVATGGKETMGTFLRERVRAGDLHLLALHLSGLDAETHALLYTQLGSLDTGPAYVREVLAQRAHLAELGIERFQHTLFVARRPGPARREAWRISMGVREIVGVTAGVRERLWKAIRSAGESDAELMRRRVRVAPDAQWMSLRHAPEGEQSEHRVRFGPGWPALEQMVTDEGVVLASLLERSMRVEDAIAGYAGMCDAQPHEVRKPLLDYIRRSLLSGMLVIEEES